MTRLAVRTGVIVQARVGSSRLPGKVLLPLEGRSVLAWVLERCRAIDGADVICCAVPEGPADDPVAEEAQRAGAEVFRGSEADVLDRYRSAASAFDLDVVLRVTADCPLLDPRIGAAVLALRRDAAADYACNNAPPSWPHGLDCEAITRAWLERAAREAERPWQREHVTPFVREHPAALRVNLPMPGEAAAHHRWTLDTHRDLAFLRAVAARLPDGRAGWDWRAVLAVVEAEPALFALNDGQDRLEGLKRSMERAA
jgi:spore coat polysaccharide biosynthesis protein SpsF